MFPLLSTILRYPVFHRVFFLIDGFEWYCKQLVKGGISYVAKGMNTLQILATTVASFSPLEYMSINNEFIALMDVHH